MWTARTVTPVTGHGRGLDRAPRRPHRRRRRPRLLHGRGETGGRRDLRGHAGELRRPRGELARRGLGELVYAAGRKDGFHRRRDPCLEPGAKVRPDWMEPFPRTIDAAKEAHADEARSIDPRV